MALILASSSTFRKQQLASLGLHPQCVAPDIDESAQGFDSPEQLAEQLSIQKALAVAPMFPTDLVIGSDQVAWFEDQQVHKPLTEDRAKEQLSQFSGQSVQFFSGLALHNGKSGETQVGHTVTQVKFRDLTSKEIDTIIQRDQPLYCAGSFKVESLGILLFDSVKSEDPCALVGLPIILLNQFLMKAGYNCLNEGANQ